MVPRPKSTDGSPASVEEHPPCTEVEINRGCIGCLAPVPVQESLAKYAVHAAFKDQRFSPMTFEELQTCSCTVSFLSELEETSSWEDWAIGQHGLLLLIQDNGETYNSTFLPKVIKGAGWSKTETIVELLKKSGFPGAKDASVFDRVQLLRYESSVARMTWAEYLELQKQ